MSFQMQIFFTSDKTEFPVLAICQSSSDKTEFPVLAICQSSHGLRFELERTVVELEIPSSPHIRI